MIYVWKCDRCHGQTEVVRPVADIDIPPDQCGSCGQDDSLKRIIVRPRNVKGVILLGETGWHDKEYTQHRSIR